MAESFDVRREKALAFLRSGDRNRMAVGEARNHVIAMYGQDVHDALMKEYPDPFEDRCLQADLFIRTREAREMTIDDLMRTVLERFGEDVKEYLFKVGRRPAGVGKKPVQTGPRCEQKLPSRAIQIQTVMVPANHDDHVEEGVRIIALCEDGSMWVRSSDFVISTLHQSLWYMLEPRSTYSW